MLILPVDSAHAMRTTVQSPGRSFEQRIPPVLRPLVRAYVLGYASSTASYPMSVVSLLTSLGSTSADAIAPTPEQEAAEH